MTICISRRSKGFTLIELLVVIAILATLASLIFLGTKTAIKAAKAAKLSNNMKNVHTALISLREEGIDTGNHNPGSYPPYAGNIDDEQGASFIWWDLAAEKLSIAVREGSQYEWKEPYKETVFQNPLSKYKLGGDRSKFRSLGNATKDSHGGFAYNGLLGDDAGAGGESEDAFVIRASQLKDATNTIWFAESDDDHAGAGWYFDGISSAPQGNYKKKAYVCMVDGSVRSYPNTIIKKPSVFEFLTTPNEKNYNNAP